MSTTFTEQAVVHGKAVPAFPPTKCILLGSITHSLLGWTEVKALNYIAEHQVRGELVTRLLYIHPDAEDLHAHLNTVDMPFNRLGATEPCPGTGVLEKLNAALR